MFKLCGTFLLIGGCVGFSYSLCMEKQKRIRLLKEFKYLYSLMQNEMLYTGEAFPGLFLRLSESVAEPLSGMLFRVSEKMTLAQSEGFEEIWQKEAAGVLRGYSLSERQRKIIFDFPAGMNLWECGGQVKSLQRQIEELGNLIAEMEQEEKSKNKVIMSLGIAAGLFLTIILL